MNVCISKSSSILQKKSINKSKNTLSRKKNVRFSSNSITNNISNANLNSSLAKIEKDLKLSKEKEKEKEIRRKPFRKNLNIYNNRKIHIKEKYDLDQLGRIEYAKEHSSANRPLKKLGEFGNNQVFCKCCGLPCITEGIIEPFKVCDSTDKYSILGQAITLYFSFYKFSFFILFTLLCALIFPSFYMIHIYYESIKNICNDSINILRNNDRKFDICDKFIKNSENKDMFLFHYNAANIFTYIQLYDNIMNGSFIENKKIIGAFNNNSYHAKKIKNLVINNSFTFFIVLISLFIINLLYIFFQNNKILEYNFELISPSDYAVIMTNMSEIYKSFRKMKYLYSNSSRISSLAEFRKKLGFLESELKDTNITEAMEFSNYIKNFVNKNDKYNVQMVNICYKLNKFKELEYKIQDYKNKLFKVDNSPRQKRRNRYFKLTGNRRKYFKSSFLGGNYINLHAKCCEKNIPIIELIRKKNNKESKLNNLLNASKNIKSDNFANVAFILFDKIDEQERFLKKYSQNIFTNVFSIIKNFKYYFCICFLSQKSIKKFKKENKELCSLAPEPDDIIFENLEITTIKRILFLLAITLISFIIITVSFIIVVILTFAQKKIDNIKFGSQTITKLILSLAMTGVISLINIIFQGILESLTKLERHMSMTNHILSFSVKLTIFTFVNSAIVPYISIIKISDDLNYDLLIDNMLMIFLVNSFVSPLMWTFNINFCLKKWKILGIENKKNPNMRHYMSQRKLNDLYEYVDIELAYKYSYISKTLLMTFFYLPLFPFGIIFSICGLILGFYLEKFNIGHIYKRPEMMSETIIKFYVSYFEVNFLMLAIGDYLFLKDRYNINYWQFINIIIFLVPIIIPYGQYLNYNFIGVNQSQIINKSYNDAFFNFYNDYERMNPFTRRIGTINYLKRLKEKDYITEEEFQNQKKYIESLNFMQIISLERPSRTVRTKRLIGRRQSLLCNIGIDKSDSKVKRLFELIKKINKSPEEEKNSINKENNFKRIWTMRYNERKIKYTNIMHLVGIIFGTEIEKEDDEEEEEGENDIISESNGNEIKISEEKKNQKICKTENNYPLALDFNEINSYNSDISNNISNNEFTNNKIYKKKKNSGKNTINKKYLLTSNFIFNDIKTEMDKKKKYLVSPPNSSLYNKNDLSNLRNDNSNNNDIANDINLKNYDANNDSSLNSNQKSSFMSSILNIVNQFLDKFRSHPKDDTINSEKYKFDNNNINN